jgi:hypothetical protein
MDSVSKRTSLSRESTMVAHGAAFLVLYSLQDLPDDRSRSLATSNKPNASPSAGAASSTSAIAARHGPQFDEDVGVARVVVRRISER